MDERNDARDSAAESAKSMTHKTGLIIGISAAVVVAIAVAVCIILYNVKQNDELKDLLIHKEYPVEVSFQVNGIDASDSSPVPLAVSGTTFDGTPYEKNLYVQGLSSKETFDLPRGIYTISVFSSPILADGTIFNVANANSNVTIENDMVENLAEGQNLNLSDVEKSVEAMPAFSTPIGLETLSPEAMTQEAIDTAIEALRESGIDEQRLEDLKQAAETKMHDAQAKIQSTSYPAQKASGLFYDNPYYTVDLPESMDGVYAVHVYGDEMIDGGQGHYVGYQCTIAPVQDARNNPLTWVHLAVYSRNNSPQGDFVTEELGSASNGNYVAIFAGKNFPDALELIDVFAPYVHVKSDLNETPSTLNASSDRADFESEYNQLIQQFANDPRQMGNTQELNAHASESYTAYDNLMNRILEVLYRRPDGSALKSQQDAWLAERDARMEAGGAANGQGSLYYISYTAPGVKMTKARIAELLQML